MSSIDKAAFAAIKDEVLSTQKPLPEHSLDWNIYQGQLDLLDRVEGLITEASKKKVKSESKAEVETSEALVEGLEDIEQQQANSSN